MSAERDRLSSIRVVREVEPTVELEQFLARIASRSVEYFGYKNSTLLRQYASLDEQLRDDYAPTMIGLGIPTVTVYPANTIHATLFEIHLPRSQRANSYLRRLQNRLMKLDLDKLTTPTEIKSKPTRTEDYLLDTTLPRQAKYEREISLVLQSGVLSEQLRAHRRILYEVAHQPQPVPGEDIVDATVLPIMKLPPKISGQAVNQFMCRVTEEAEHGSLVSVYVNEVELNAKIR